MTAYTLSTYRLSPYTLAAGDTLAIGSSGIVSAPDSNAPAVTGVGSDLISVDGAIFGYGASEAIRLTGVANVVGVGPGGFIVATGTAPAITLTGTGNKISNSGQISAARVAISANGAPQQFVLYATSLVQGGTDGIVLQAGGQSIANLGRIIGSTGLAIAISGGGNALFNGVGGVISGATTAVNFDSGPANSIVNNGVIVSYGFPCIQSASPLALVNTGSISGTYYGVFTTGDFSSIFNSGFIVASGNTSIGLSVSAGNDVVINNGFLQGVFAANLGGGNDLFDGRNGYQFGGVFGTAGDDVIFGGALNDFLYGGDDNDQLSGGGAGDYLDGENGFDYARYDTGGAVTASLATPAANTGDAAGDTYVSIEGLIGSHAGDLLVGDGGANTLFGLGGMDGIAGGDGNDTIYGGDGGDNIAGQAGNDVIYGGAGGDVLAGGAGGDVFVYSSLADAGDLIADFNAGGVRDSFDIRPIFDSTGYTGTTPRVGNILKVLQNGADTDVYLYNTFLFRVANVYAPALDDSYFRFQ